MCIMTSCEYDVRALALVIIRIDHRHQSSQYYMRTLSLVTYHMYNHERERAHIIFTMRWLRLVGSLKS